MWYFDFEYPMTLKVSIKLLYAANYQQVRVKFILIVLSKIHSKKAVLWGFKALGDNLIYTQ